MSGNNNNYGREKEKIISKKKNESLLASRIRAGALGRRHARRSAEGREALRGENDLSMFLQKILFAIFTE